MIIHNTGSNFAIILQALLLWRENTALRKKKHSPVEFHQEVLFSQQKRLITSTLFIWLCYWAGKNAFRPESLQGFQLESDGPYALGSDASEGNLYSKCQYQTAV